MQRPLYLSILMMMGEVAIAFLISTPTLAEVVPDSTLSENSRVNRQGNVRVIEGGTQRGTNLFHSFQEFSLPTGGTAQFNNSGAIENIFTRVTGGSRSEIDGLIRTNGTANLFLLNPNGILFGRNASLNIGGSFLATTADSLNFADGTSFSAINPQASSLLTVSVPIGLQFGSNPRPIINRAQLTATGLRVPTNETLALVGGELRFPGGVVTSTGGNIELGAVGANSLPTQVDLSLTDTGLALSYPNVENFQDIQFSNGASVIVSGQSRGSIQIQGRNIRLSDQSQIYTDTQAENAGRAITVNASQSATLQNGSIIATFASGDRPAGDILVRAADSVQLLGTADNNDRTPSAIGSQVDETATGNGGNVTIQTNRLIARNGGGIEASTFGAGQAGNILIQAADSVKLSGVTVFGTGVRDQTSSGIFAQVARGAIDNAGDAGSITIQTGDLMLLGGAQISSAARTDGAGGTITINAANSIRLSGQSPNATPTVGRSGIFVSAERSASGNAGQLNIATPQIIVEANGEISANNFGPGQGGTIRIDTNQLTVQSGGDIRATSFANGLAGDVIITADRINLDRGQLTANTRAGESSNANIQLQGVNLLVLRNQSRIAARAAENARGGNIDIAAPEGFVAAIIGEDNSIVADAFAGQGGNIQINAISLIGLQEQPFTLNNGTNDIDASSQFGAPGSVTLNQIDADPSRGTVELPADLIDASRLVSQNCSARGAIARTPSEFVITGRGGLSPSPLEPLNASSTLPHWITPGVPTQPNPELQDKASGRSLRDTPEESSHPSPEILEAQGWVRTAQGAIVLTAEAPVTTQTIATGLSCSNAQQ